MYMGPRENMEAAAALAKENTEREKKRSRTQEGTNYNLVAWRMYT